MQQTHPKTFVELAKHIENTLKTRDVFYSVASSTQPEGQATLVSLELREVRFLKYGLSGVYLQFEAVCNSESSTVQARTDHSLFVALGVYDLTLGSSTARDENGNTSRTITCQVGRPLLSGALHEDVERLCGNNACKAAAGAVKSVRASEAYKSEAAELRSIESQIRKLQKRQAQYQGKLTARETAAQQRVLPVTGKVKGKLPFQVVIA